MRKRLISFVLSGMLAVIPAGTIFAEELSSGDETAVILEDDSGLNSDSIIPSGESDHVQENNSYGEDSPAETASEDLLSAGEANEGIIDIGGLSPDMPQIVIEDQQIDSSGASTASGSEQIQVTGIRNYDYAYQVLTLVNNERKAQGLSTLKMDRSLLESAMVRAAELTIFFSHNRPDGTLCFSANGKMNAENIALGQRSPSAVMNSWMNSAGHRGNILTGYYSSIGIGCFEIDGTLFWVQCFGSGSAETVSQPANSAVNQTVNVRNIDIDGSTFFIQLYGPDSINQGENVQYYAYLLDPENYSGVRLTESSIVFSSSNPAVAAVTGPETITAIGPGTATITAKTPKGLFSTTFTLTVNAAPQQPRLIAAYNGAKGIGIKFFSVSDADEYVIYRKYNGVWEPVRTISADSSELQADGNRLMYTDTTVARLYGKGYIYSVAAKKDDLTSTYNTAGVAIYRLTPPALISITNSAAGTATVTWKGVFGRTETNGAYDLQYAEYKDGKAGTFKSVTALPGYNNLTLSATVNGLKKGSRYVFRIRCSKTNKDRGTYYSEYSPWLSVTITK